MRHPAPNLPTCDPLEPRLLMSGDLPPNQFIDPDQIPDAVQSDTLWQVNGDYPDHLEDQLFSRGSAVLRRNLANDGTAHAWHLSAQATGYMVVKLDDHRGGLDAYLQVLDGDGNVVAENDNFRGTGSSLYFWAEQGQTYTLRCMAARNTSGWYALSLRFMRDDYAKTPEDAVSLNVDENSQSFYGNMDYGRDRDLFEITPTQTGVLQVDLSAYRSRLDGALAIYDSDLNLMKVNWDARRYTNNARLLYNVQAGQTYYLLALGQNNRTQGQYRVSMELLVDDYANSWGSADTVTLADDGSGALTGRVNYVRDVDAMTFIAPTDGLMTVSAQTAGQFNALVYVFDADFNLAGYDRTPDGTGSFQFRVTAGERYFLGVRADNRADVGDYQLSFETVEVAPVPNGVTPDPGSSVRTDVVTVGEKLVFRVIGTNGSDNLTVSQSGGNYIVNGVTYAGGGATHVAIYGFGGADGIRTTYSITSTLAIWGGAGNDAIYENARGSATIAGGDGDDLIITLGGGADELHGQAGFDTTWYDSTDNFTDLDAAENRANTNHRVGQFWQPWTSDSGSGDYVSLSINAQNLRDPSLAGYATGYANFAHRDVFNNGPQFNDINQGALGDCYYLASLSTIAHQNPGVIEQMITPLGDGTYAVRYFGSTGQEVYLRIDGDLPVRNGSLIYAQASPTGEIWVSLMEKAYAFYRRGQNSYASIEGGWMTEAFHDLTDGSTASYYNGSYSPTTIANVIRTALANGYAITAGSWWGISGPIIGGHAYMIGNIDNNNNVTVYNPWGVDGTSNGSNPADGVVEISISQFMQYFSYTQLCTL